MIKAAFFGTRPYSYGFNAALATFAVTASGSTQDRVLLRAVIASLLAWALFNWTSDSVQNDPGKPRVNVLVRAGVFSLCTAASLTAMSFFYLVLYFASINLYAVKATQSVLGPLGSLLRGVTVICALLWLGSFASTSALPLVFLPTFWFVVVLVVRRNLVGDIRDSKTDRFELPVRVSKRWTLAILLLLSMGLVVLSAWSTGSPILVITLASSFTLLSFLIIYRNAFPWAGFQAHRFLVVIDTVLVCLLSLQHHVPVVYVGAIMVVALGLSWTYGRIPGKRYLAPAMQADVSNQV